MGITDSKDKDGASCCSLFVLNIFNHEELRKTSLNPISNSMNKSSITNIQNMPRTKENQDISRRESNSRFDNMPVASKVDLDNFSLVKVEISIF